VDGPELRQNAEIQLHHRLAMLMLSLAVTASAVLLYPRIGTELVPEDDQGEFNVSVNLPTGTSFQRTEEYFKDLEPMLRKLPAVQTVFTNVNAGQANFFVGMIPLEEREVSYIDKIRSAVGIPSAQNKLVVSQQDLIPSRSDYGSRSLSRNSSNVSGGTDLSGRIHGRRQ
jgi:multidrug efflux pump subunit AcrB